MYGLKVKQIEELREDPFIEDILDANGVIKTKNESRILSGHFNLVPGVITERMASILAGMNSNITLETRYLSAIKPGDTIGFRGGREDPEIYVVGEKSKSILTTTNVSGRDLNHYDFPTKYKCIDFDKGLINHHLLQSADFELVSGASVMDETGYFSGHFRVPENYPFLIENKLPFPFMKEVANQIVSLSNSITNNPEGIQLGSAILLANSHIARDASEYSILAPGGSLVVVSGKAGIDPRNPKRGLIAEYTAHNESVPLFHGKITGTKIQTKMLFR